MAKTDFGPEVRSAQTQATDKAMVGRAAGTTHTASKATPVPPRATPRPAPDNPMANKQVHTAPPPMPMDGMGDMQRVNHAAGIAHAILGGRKMM